MHNNQLSQDRISDIKALAKKKLIAYNKLDNVVGSDIFNIIESEGIILYYPLEDCNVWGFSETIQGKSFVCINTSLQYEKQIFAAAHELYHLWTDDFNENTGEIILSKNTIDPDDSEDVELMANRFAAEFLVNEELLRHKAAFFRVDKNSVDIRDIVRLSNHFVVPYRTMVKRFYETNMCSQEQYKYLISLRESQVEIWRSRLGLSMPARKEYIKLHDLVDKAMGLYENSLITYEKLEYLLRLSGLTPKAMGVGEKAHYMPPSDSELDEIMEE